MVVAVCTVLAEAAAVLPCWRPRADYCATTPPLSTVTENTTEVASAVFKPLLTADR